MQPIANMLNGAHTRPKFGLQLLQGNGDPLSTSITSGKEDYLNVFQGR